MGTLNQIGLSFGTDKSSGIHGYLDKYEKYLPFSREDKIRIFEIGVFNGASLKTWYEYFYNARVIGIDIDPKFRESYGVGFNVAIGSQNDHEFLMRVNTTYGPFDLIIDDGSHQNIDQIFTFKVLFPLLNPNGVYIIEDTCTSYWKKFGGGLYFAGSCIEYFKGLIDQVNFYGEFLNHTSATIPRRARRDDLLLQQFADRDLIGTTIESLNFLNSIILVRKRDIIKAEE